MRIKGQIKPKANWRTVDSPKKERTNEFVLFAILLYTANKTNSFLCFLGESTAHQSCFRFYLTFSEIQVKQIRVNQGVGIFNSPYDLSLNIVRIERSKL